MRDTFYKCKRHVGAGPCACPQCESAEARKCGSHKTTGKAGGFTLLEVMIALAIIGTALTVIIHTVNYHADIMYENTLTTRMYQLAKEKMNDLETAPRSTEAEISQGDLTYENIVSPIGDTGLVELKTVVRGGRTQVVLQEIVVAQDSVSGVKTQ